MKLDLWLDKGFTLTDRLDTKPAVQRDIDQDILDEKLQRGDILQEIRLRRYPSIEVELDRLYAGSFRGTLDELEQKLFDMGYRNNPTAYVESTDELGPDDGSYAQQIIKEDSELPNLNVERPFGMIPLYSRLKLQNHIATFVDDEFIHILSHQEISAWLQPIRHLTISEGDGEIGIREFRQSWSDEFNEELPTPLR